MSQFPKISLWLVGLVAVGFFFTSISFTPASVEGGFVGADFDVAGPLTQTDFEELPFSSGRSPEIPVEEKMWNGDGIPLNDISARPSPTNSGPNQVLLSLFAGEREVPMRLIAGWAPKAERGCRCVAPRAFFVPRERRSRSPPEKRLFADAEGPALGQDCAIELICRGIPYEKNLC